MTALEHHIEQGMFLRVCGDAALQGPMLWLHGLGESGLSFEPIVQHSQLAGWRHLVPDLPGYGRSAWPRQVLSLTEQASRLAAWLNSRGEQPAVVVGHSMGAVLGLLLADRHPSSVRALINVEGNVSLDDCFFSGQAARLGFDEFLAGGFAQLRDTVYQDGLGDPPLRGYYASLRLADPHSYHRHSRDLVALSAAGSLAGRMAALPMPVHFVAGAPHGVSERSQALLRAAGVSSTTITPAGHWPFIDQPEAFAATMQRVLARV